MEKKMRVYFETFEQAEKLKDLLSGSVNIYSDAKEPELFYIALDDPMYPYSHVAIEKLIDEISFYAACKTINILKIQGFELSTPREPIIFKNVEFCFQNSSGTTTNVIIHKNRMRICVE